MLGGLGGESSGEQGVGMIVLMTVLLRSNNETYKGVGVPYFVLKLKLHAYFEVKYLR